MQSNSYKTINGVYRCILSKDKGKQCDIIMMCINFARVFCAKMKVGKVILTMCIDFLDVF